MTPCGRRSVSFAGQVAGIEWSGERARDVAELACVPQTTAADDRLPDVVFRLGARPDTDVLTLFEGTQCLYRGTAVGTAAHLLVEAVLSSLIGNSADGLVIHAAVVGRGGDGVLLPGPTGSGKTMLSAWLALRGLDHRSDEACYLAAAESPVECFRRPFSFKGPWAQLLGLEGFDRRRVLQDDSVSLVPRELLTTASDPAPIVPRLIVFPQFRADAPFTLARLTPARAAVRLIETVANARNLPDHGVRQVTALARAVDAYSLIYGRFAELDPLVELIDSLH